MTTALVTGSNGQTGSYLCEHLLANGQEVYGVVRRTSQHSTQNIDHLICNENFHMVSGDVTDQESISQLVRSIKPQYIYHLAAQSYVGASWDQPFHTLDVTGVGTLKVLEATRTEHPNARVYLACSSEIFGNQPGPHNENTPMKPCSVYGASKVLLRHLGHIYRQSFGMFVSCGILYNHESERRGEQFVTRRITQAVAKIKHGQQNKLTLGNMSACRDWGFAKDYAEAMALIIQATNPSDYVIATGKAHSVEEFVRLAFKAVNIDNWQDFVQVDESLKRPNDIGMLLGDATKARTELGWQPRTSFEDMVTRMVANDLELVRQNKARVKLGQPITKAKN